MGNIADKILSAFEEIYGDYKNPIVISHKKW